MHAVPKLYSKTEETTHFYSKTVQNSDRCVKIVLKSGRSLSEDINEETVDGIPIKTLKKELEPQITSDSRFDLLGDTIYQDTAKGSNNSAAQNLNQVKNGSLDYSQTYRTSKSQYNKIYGYTEESIQNSNENYYKKYGFKYPKTLESSLENEERGLNKIKNKVIDSISGGADKHSNSSLIKMIDYKKTIYNDFTKKKVQTQPETPAEFIRISNAISKHRLITDFNSQPEQDYIIIHSQDEIKGKTQNYRQTHNSGMNSRKDSQYSSSNTSVFREDEKITEMMKDAYNY